MRLRGCSPVPQCHRRQETSGRYCHRYGVVWRVLKKIIDPIIKGSPYGNRKQIGISYTEYRRLYN
jgi:hypothetical protein